MVKAILFDFDGVIGDTYDINFAVSKAINGDITEQDFVEFCKGNAFESSKIKIEEKHMSSLSKEQRQRFTKKHLFPLEETLSELAKKFQLFIVSSTSDENIKLFLEMKKYDRFFHGIFGATTHRSKIKKFKMIFDQHNLTPEECLFVTDTVGDIIEARSVGVRTIGVTWGYHKEDLLSEQKPLAIAHDADELLDCINKHSQ